MLRAIHILITYLSALLRKKMFETKFVEKNEIHILSSITYFSKIVPFMR